MKAGVEKVLGGATVLCNLCVVPMHLVTPKGNSLLNDHPPQTPREVKRQCF